MTNTSLDPARADHVGLALAEYLAGAHTGFSGYVEYPQPIGRGFDSFIYAFRLRNDGRLAPEWAGRLVLRIASTPDRGAVLRREAEVAAWARVAGYPAVVPIAVEDHDRALGLPFIIMPFAGDTALDVIKRRPWQMRAVLSSVGELHGRVHSLPLEGCPLSAANDFRTQAFDGLTEYVGRVAPGTFDRELAWLQARRAIVRPCAPSMLHNDFHPLNVLVDDDGAMTVIDWTDAATGDRHYDLGRTLALLWFAKIAATSRPERMALTLMRGFMRRWHMTGYRRVLDVDARALHFWETYHALRSSVQLTELGTRDRSELTPMASGLGGGLLDEAKRRLRTLIGSADGI